MSRRGKSVGPARESPFVPGNGRTRSLSSRSSLRDSSETEDEEVNQQPIPNRSTMTVQEMATLFASDYGQDSQSVNAAGRSMAMMNLNRRGNTERKEAEGAGIESVRSPLEEECGAVLSDEVRQLKFSKPIGPSPVYESGNPDATIFTNYFRVHLREEWRLYRFHTTFQPDVGAMQKRKEIIHQVHSDMGGVVYLFDGTSLISNVNLTAGNEMILITTLDEDTKQLIDLTLKLVATPGREDPIFAQVFNLIIRKSMFLMKLEELGRNFYDRSAPIIIPNHRIQLWPGYITSIRPYEDNILLSVEVTHRVLRMDTVLSVMNGLRNSRNYREDVAKELQYSIIMTHYNKKTYKVEDIEWNSNPNSRFECRGMPITYRQYFSDVYGEKIQDLEQPLLVVSPTKRDKSRGVENKCLLVPELCQLTGLNDSMRANMSLMKEIGVHLHMGPEERVKAIEKFITELNTNPKVVKHFKEWRVTIDPEMVTCPVDIMKKESILFSSGVVPTNAQADWTVAFRSQKMLKVKEMKNWTIIFPTKDKDGVTNFIRTCIKVASALDFKISQPSNIIEIQDVRMPSYLRALNSLSLPVDIVVVILPQKASEPYTTIKRFLSVDLGVPSQGFVAKNLYSKGIMSIITKVVIQMNAKLGGEPWAVKIPLKNAMIVGFDVLKSKQGAYVGAMVSTTSLTMGSYYSHTCPYSDTKQLAAGLNEGISKSINCFMDNNGNTPPERVIVYREGIANDAEDVTSERESKIILECLTKVYREKGMAPPKFAFIVVNRRCGTRLFDLKNSKFVNPVPGTIVQSKITLPNIDNFFLVAQAARQGTVAPCSYRVYYDSINLSADKIHLMTYKFCHLYYNWSGTVAAPAPCQYAKKLAFMAVNVFGGENPVKKDLNNTLHFL